LTTWATSFGSSGAGLAKTVVRGCWFEKVTGAPL